MLQKSVLILLLLLGTISTAYALDITFEVKGEQQGTIEVAIWSEAQKDSFPSVLKDAVYKTTLHDNKKTVTIDDKVLKENQKYAIAAYIDANNNGKLDFHWYGAPAEKTGSSLNHRPRFSAPSFKDSYFIAGQVKKLHIVLK